VAILVPIVLLSWIPACLILFMALPRTIAVTALVLVAWLFLPAAGLDISGLPDYTKTSAFSYGGILATLIFAPDRFQRLRFSIVDAGVLMFCVSGFAASIVNGLGPYDGAATMMSTTTSWGMPYLLGRVHFDEAAPMRTFVKAIALVGVVYSPFCWLEMGAGPILASKVYALTLYEDIRFGGARPRVFLYKGLELGMWMAACSLVGVWLWRSGVIRRMFGLPFGAVVLPFLILTTILCRSSGAIALLGVGVAVLWVCRRFDNRAPMYALIGVTFLYVGVRCLDLWDYSGTISFLARNFDPSRAQSLEFRFQNEDMLIGKAVQQPVFGWGGWGRSRVYDESGKDLTITDGLWIIILGSAGFVGLGGFLSLILGPALLFTYRYPARRWTEPDVAVLAALACVLASYSIDCLLNAFPNGVYSVAAGGLAARLAATKRGREEHLLEGWGTGPEIEAVELPGAASAEVRLAERYMAIARASRASGAYDEAAEARRHALELLAARLEADPSDAVAARMNLDCLNDLAWLMATRPDPGPDERATAAAVAREAVEAAPSEPTYWNTLGLALVRAGDDAGAVAAARRSMELDEAWNGYDMAVLALGEARLGRRDEAARWLAEAARWRDESGGEATLDELVREADDALHA